MSIPFRGVSQSQDVRFSDKHKKLKDTMKFPEELSTKIDVRRVNMKVIKSWAEQRVNELLGMEDEVVVEMLNNYLDQPKLDGKEIQINMTGFLQKNTSLFMKELWTLMRDAMTSDHGIPPQLLELESKKRELEKEQFEKTRLAVLARQQEIEAALRRQREEQERAYRESIDKSRAAVEAHRQAVAGEGPGAAERVPSRSRSADIGGDVAVKRDSRERSRSRERERAGQGAAPGEGKAY